MRTTNARKFREGCCLALLLGFVFAVSTAHASDRSALENAVKKLDNEMSKHLRTKNLASLSISVVHQDKLLYSNAFGFANVEQKLRATTETLYPIGSVTKIFTSTMLMKLVEEGKIELESDVTKWIPELKVKPDGPGNDRITLLQLATHTSGLPRDLPASFIVDYALDRWIMSDGVESMLWYTSKEEMLRTAKNLHRDTPGYQQKSYSNLGISLLGVALERACDKSLVEWMAEEIFDPLDMDHTGFLDGSARDGILATPYCPSIYDGRLLPAPEWDLGYNLYAGGIYSTSEDLARFLMSQFNSAKRLHLLEDDSRHLMQFIPITWGFTSDSEHRKLEHAGAHLGSSCFVVLIPDLEIGVVAMTNYHNPYAHPMPIVTIGWELIDYLKAGVLEERQQQTSASLHRYAGTFRTSCGAWEAVVTPGRETVTLTISDLNDGGNELELTDLHTFSSPSDDSHYPLVRYHETKRGKLPWFDYFGHRFYRDNNIR